MEPAGLEALALGTLPTRLGASALGPLPTRLGASALERRYFCSPGRRGLCCSFESAKRTKRPFRLFGRLGQGRDWSSSLDLEGWVSDLSLPRYRLSKWTSCRSILEAITGEVTT